MGKEALKSELNIEPEKFDKVFSQVWHDNEDPEDRVHITTQLENEILRVVDKWTKQVHEKANEGGTPDGLFWWLRAHKPLEKQQ